MEYCSIRSLRLCATGKRRSDSKVVVTAVIVVEKELLKRGVCVLGEHPLKSIGIGRVS